MLCHLQDEPSITTSHLQSVQDRRKTFVELHVHDGTDDGHDATAGGCSGGSRSDIVPAWITERENIWIKSRKKNHAFRYQVGK